MIRINLLPQEDSPQQRTLRLPKVGSLVPLVAVVLVVAGMALAFTYQSRRVAELKDGIAKAEAESRRLAPEIAKVQSLNREREEVNRRLDVITQLDRDRYFRVHLLDEINRALPEHMWLTTIEEQAGNKLALEGVTFSNFLVSDVLQNLNRSPYVAAVDLVVAEKGLIKDVPVVKFKATAVARRQPGTAVLGAGVAPGDSTLAAPGETMDVDAAAVSGS
jgi:type IV pilus assembly protein PilN